MSLFTAYYVSEMYLLLLLRVTHQSQISSPRTIITANTSWALKRDSKRDEDIQVEDHNTSRIFGVNPEKVLKLIGCF